MGNIFTSLSALYDQSYPPKPHWTSDDVPDLTGKVILVTGGNTGIGKETARVCLGKNAKVYVGCRNGAKAKEAIEDIKRSTEKLDIHFLKLDLSSLKAVKKAAEDFQRKEQCLHILFNNAGVMLPPLDQLTADGYDLQFGTNVLGHYYLTILLLPMLTATAKMVPEANVRVVNSSSSGILFTPAQIIHWDTLRGSDLATQAAREKLGAQSLYCQSKSGNLLFSNELAKRYADQGIVSTALNPGNIQTDLGRNYTGWLRWLTDFTLNIQPVSNGCITQLYAGTSPEGANLNGKYLYPWARVGESRADHHNAELAERLWDWCAEQVKNV